MNKNYDVMNFILRMPRVAILTDITKIVTMFIRKILEDSKKVKIIKNYVSKWNLYPYFLISVYLNVRIFLICRFPVKNTDVSRTQAVRHMEFLNLF